MPIVRETLPGARDIRPSRVNWVQARQNLEDNPGKWVLMASNVASSVSDQLRKGRNKTFRIGLKYFEFSTRKPSDKGYEANRTDLWGRFTPEGWVYADEETA